MRVGLFIPCYIDQFYPQVGLATLKLLEHFGCEVDFPDGQTCCGQPMSNTGLADAARPFAEKFVQNFSGFDYIVCPSGSCTSMVRLHYSELIHESEPLKKIQLQTYELCEFLVDVLKVKPFTGRFPHKVGLHQSCHGLRELRLGKSTETVGQGYNKVRSLLEPLDGIVFADLQRPDECCGFGGTFAVAEEAVSCMMGLDRILDHERSGTEILTGNDMSCLMHLDGLLRRKKHPIRVMHIAEILAKVMA